MTANTHAASPGMPLGGDPRRPQSMADLGSWVWDRGRREEEPITVRLSNLRPTSAAGPQPAALLVPTMMPLAMR